MHRYLTEYEVDGERCGDHVDAVDWEHAKLLCDQRGRGEIVVGVLYAVVDAQNFSPERASAMCKAFAESGEDEPPDASEFDNDLS